MRKKIILLVIVSAFLLVSCKEKEIEKYTYPQATDEQILEQIVEPNILALDALTEKDYEDFKNIEVTEDQREAYRLKDKIYQAILTSKDDLGAFVETVDFYMVEADNGIQLVQLAKFEQRDVLFIMTLSKDFSQLLDMSFEPEYTIGEKLSKAGLNTLMGMGTVFCALIFIAFLISQFKHINKLEQRRAKKLKPVAIETKTEEIIETVIDEQDQLELIAVITAAIAATTNQSADQLVVRSIKRRV